MSSFPLLLVLAACTYNPSASRPIKVQRRQMRTHSLAQKDRLPASALAARRERRSSKFLPICPIRPCSRDCQKSGGDQVAPRFLSKSDHLLSAGHVSRAPCNLDILISRLALHASTSSTPKGGAVRDAVNPAHTTHGVDSAKTSYLKDRSRDGNVLGSAAAAAAGSRC